MVRLERIKVYFLWFTNMPPYYKAVQMCQMYGDPPDLSVHVHVQCSLSSVTLKILTIISDSKELLRPLPSIWYPWTCSLCK